MSCGAAAKHDMGLALLAHVKNEDSCDDQAEGGGGEDQPVAQLDLPEDVGDVEDQVTDQRGDDGRNGRGRIPDAQVFARVFQGGQGIDGQRPVDAHVDAVAQAEDDAERPEPDGQTAGEDDEGGGGQAHADGRNAHQWGAPAQAIREDAGENAAHYAAAKRQHGNDGSHLYKIGDALHAGEVVFDIGHKQGQPQHDAEAGEEDDGEVIGSPGRDPVLHEP